MDYPLQRPKKVMRNSKDGIEYVSYCDKLPQNTLDFKTLNKKVNESVIIPSDIHALWRLLLNSYQSNN